MIPSPRTWAAIFRPWTPCVRPSERILLKVRNGSGRPFWKTRCTDQFIGRHPFEVPPSLVNQEQENLFREQWERYSQYGINPAQMDHTKLLEALKPMAERRARVKILLERIAEQEGLSVDDAEVEATLARIAVHSGKDVTEVRKFYQERDLTGSPRKSS